MCQNYNENLDIYLSKENLPGHFLLLQIIVSSFFPEQEPPCCSLITFCLVFVFLPPPQLFVHSEYMDQDPQEQSTKKSI